MFDATKVRKNERKTYLKFAYFFSQIVQTFALPSTLQKQ